MSASRLERSGSILSSRRLGLASVAAFVACAACCTLPLLAAAGVSSGVVTVLSSVFRPGSELVAGAGVFVVALALMTIWRRLNGRGSSACGPACKVDGSCCDRGVAKST